MNWKKTTAYFIWQSIRRAESWQQFVQFWSYRKPWLASFQEGRNSIADELPWLPFHAQAFLKDQLQPSFKVFEFGGGGSTLFFCKYAGEVITVEDHEEWFSTLTQVVKTKNYPNWVGYLKKPEPFTGKHPRSPQNPADFMSGAKGLENLSFESYARTIDQYPNDYFDLILVDGRSRPACIRLAMPHLKPGGLLVVDNTERPYYLAAFEKEFAANYTREMNTFFPVAYTPDFTRTTILRKKQ